MNTKRLVFTSCLAAAALIASAALGEMHKKSKATSASKPQRMAPRTTQMTPAYHRSIASATARTRQYASTPRYAATRQYAGTRQYGNTRYYRGGRYYGGTSYYGVIPYYGDSRYYYGGGWPYAYYGSSFWPSGSYGYYPYSYYDGYSYYGGYPYNYSYYQPAGYDTATVAAVQRRLGELGYYHGLVDGIMGPRTRAAIAAYESTHNLAVDGTVNPRLLARIGLA